jgi:hypothetical protein
MPSITPMMSAIFFELPMMASMVATTWPTTSPPRSAAALAEPASSDALRAVSELFCSVEVSSSIEAAVCCRLAACSPVRWLRSALPGAIWWEPVALESLVWRSWATMPTRLVFMRISAFSSRAGSSLRSTVICVVKSPRAKVSASSTARPIGRAARR